MAARPPPRRSPRRPTSGRAPAAAPAPARSLAAPRAVARAPLVRERSDGDFEVLLGAVRGEVEARLAGLLDTKVADARRLGADVEAMAAAVRDLTLRGGKRFRPALLVAAYRAVDGQAPLEPALDAGVALELLQTYLLVHDDWMDQDDMRRGGPAVHAMLTRHFGSRAAGEASGVLAGDWASALSLEAIARLDVPADRIARVVTMFAQIEQDAIFGQQLDLSGRPQDVELMNDLKTGSYTVRGPLMLGAALAGASPAVLGRFERFARPLGVAFQLRDDLLGAFGDPAQTGKPRGSDLRAGKRTLLVTEALARGTNADRRTLLDALGKRDAKDDEVERIVELYEKLGARRAVESRLDELVREALAALEGARLSKLGASWLRGAAEALSRRRA